MVVLSSGRVVDILSSVLVSWRVVPRSIMTSQKVIGLVLYSVLVSIVCLLDVTVSTHLVW